MIVNNIKKFIQNTKHFFFFFTIFFLLCFNAFSANVLFIDLSNISSISEKKLHLACKFYGLYFNRLILQDQISLADTLRNLDFRAVVISAKSMSILDRIDFFSILKILKNKNVPLLISGISSDIGSELLEEWSDGAILGCKKATDVLAGNFYGVSDVRSLTQQLADINIPLDIKEMNYIFFNDKQKVQSIINVENIKDEIQKPVFVKTTVDDVEVFFLSKYQFVESLSEMRNRDKLMPYDKLSSQKNVYILDILSIMIFLKYACGESCWHSIKNYANFTIDDPWLTEPYGHLSYRDLLKQMEKSKFHTTVGFIPWNYDRSDPKVVSLLHNHPDKFSICIHGNNHDHYEFYKYETDPDDPWPAKSLDLHEKNIIQALARMEIFKRLTGLSYDKIMIFPHGIAPAKTLNLLKKYNFLATANDGNIPLGSNIPNEPLFHLRPITLRYEGFPSIQRYASNRTKAEIAIDLFLDNPLLFYAHHDLFENGIDAFNKTAEIINNIQPDIFWQSLGYILNHYNLRRLRNDGNYDIIAFSNNFFIENDNEQDLTFFIRKKESFTSPIKQITVDGQHYPYKKLKDNLQMKIFIPAKETRHIVIEYDNDLDLSSIDVSKKNPRVNRLRRLSDFRDITLSRSMFGRCISHFYYDTGIYKWGLKRLIIIFIILSIIAVFLIVGTWYVLRQRKKRPKKIKAKKDNKCN